MSFQEKYQEYKQRKEAKKFFNQNNDYHLEAIDYVKMIIVGLITSIVLTIVFEVISLQIGWNISIFYLLAGYGTGYVTLKVVRYGSEKVGMVAAICYVVGVILANVPFYYLTWQNHLPFLVIIQMIITSLLSNIIGLLFIVVGAVTAFSIGKD